MESMKEIVQKEGEIKWRSQDEGSNVHALCKEIEELWKEGKRVGGGWWHRRRVRKGMLFCGGRIIL